MANPRAPQPSVFKLLSSLALNIHQGVLTLYLASCFFVLFTLCVLLSPVSMRKGSLFLCFLLVGLVSHSSVTPALCRRLQGSDIKPDCECGTPSHHGGGHGWQAPPHGSSGTPTPSHGSSGHVPTPSHGGGGYYPSPSSHSPPVIVVTPPSTPIVTPPITPTPITPVNPTPSIPDPSVPPFAPGSCSYWISHPEAIGAIFNYWSTIGQSFGAACSSAFGKNISLSDALKNTRTDGIGALYREGTAALLNSIACKNYSFTSQQVKDAFAAAVISDKAAAAQAEIFKQANTSGVKH